MQLSTNIIVVIVVQSLGHCAAFTLFDGLGVGIDEAGELAHKVWNFLRTGHEDESNEKRFEFNRTGLPIPDLRFLGLLSSFPVLDRSLAKFLGHNIEGENDASFKSLLSEFNRKTQKIEAIFNDILPLIPEDGDWLGDQVETDNMVKLETLAVGHLAGETLEKALKDLHDFVLPNWRNQGSFIYSLLEHLKKELASDRRGCASHSQQETLHALISKIIATEMKAYVLHVFLYYYEHHVMEDHNPDNSKQNVDDKFEELHREYHARLKKYSGMFVRAMKHASRKFHACDPAKTKADQQYVTLDGLVHRYHYAYQHANMEVYPIACNGESDCNEFEPFRKPVVTCTVSDQHGKVVENFISGCDSTTCSFCALGTPKQVEQLVKYCECYNNFPESFADHLVNLQPIETDVEQNMVLTGAKIIIKNGLLQFEIQQGELLEDLHIVAGGWKRMEDIGERVLAARLEKRYYGEDPAVEENVDYAVFSPKFNTLNLNEVTVPDGYILTGLKFEHSKCGLHLRVLGRPFDHETGKLLGTGEPEIFKAAVNQREIIEISDKADIVLNGRLTYPNKKPSLIQLRRLENSNGKTIAPGFDIVPVMSSPPSPLAGAGLIYRTTEDKTFMGVIGLELISINYVSYMARELENVEKFAGHTIKPMSH